MFDRQIFLSNLIGQFYAIKIQIKKMTSKKRDKPLPQPPVPLKRKQSKPLPKIPNKDELKKKYITEIIETEKQYIQHLQNVQNVTLSNFKNLTSIRIITNLL